MSDNDIIAEYIKERYPEVLTTADFALFKLEIACRKFANDFLESFKKIDLQEIQKLANKINEHNGQQEDKP